MINEDVEKAVQKIHVTVKLFSALDRLVSHYDRSTGIQVDLPEGATVADLISSLGLTSKEARVVFVRNMVRRSDYILTDGEQVSVFGLIGGG